MLDQNESGMDLGWYAPYVQVTAETWTNDGSNYAVTVLAEETPVAFVYNGISHAVMLATPADLEDFALGFSLTEGILVSPSEMHACEIEGDETGVRVMMTIASERFFCLKERRRNLAGRTGCGLCGTESLEQAVCLPPRVNSLASFNAETLHAGLAQMEAMQQLRQKTGATHAAAWMASNGQVTSMREDVGRHNALDKLIGALTRSGADVSTGACLVTSRASYEMVHKCAAANIGFLAAISAPTALAVRMAQQAELALVGLVRPRSHVVYCGAERLRDT